MWEIIRQGETKSWNSPSVQGLPTVLHIFSFSTELKRSGNWKGDNSAARAPHTPMKSFRGIRVLHFGPILCISFTWGLWKENKKSLLYNDNTWKVFSIRLMHHCQSGRWNRIVPFWMGNINKGDSRLERDGELRMDGWARVGERRRAS